ncbi:MAG TPA: outer membrane beta-barrel protein [Beijerinckiaceae bacterium]|jgi:opacity protein-like surface antigen
MGSFKSLALAGVLAVASSASALAADLLPPPPPMPYQPAPDFGGWYLRGDVGVSSYNRGKFSSPDQPPAVFYGEDLGAGAFAGVGVGYQFNGWLRADVTGEYRFSKGFKVFDKVSFPSGTVINETTQGDFTSGVFLLNGYVDFGTWYGITPFIGAGVGFAHNMLSGFSDQSIVLTPDPVTGVTVASPSGGWLGNGNKNHLAWALYAGLGYSVTPNLKLEMGYRYLNLGEAVTGPLNCFCGSTFSALKVKDLDSHDIKIGFRYMLAAPPPPAFEAPIVRKY